jgi:hypothetical protein
MNFAEKHNVATVFSQFLNDFFNFSTGLQIQI